VHHGKEENILFANLEEKNLSSKHHAVMNELIAEHQYSREISNKCLDAAFKYFEGEDTAQEICGCLEELVLFYPNHMLKEDNFFPGAVLGYFTPEEQEKMIREFEKYDTKTLHWKYRKVEPALIERLNHLEHANWEAHTTGFPGAQW
jgi:hemerythrin-like domain-containing protein